MDIYRRLISSGNIDIGTTYVDDDLRVHDPSFYFSNIKFSHIESAMAGTYGEEVSLFHDDFRVVNKEPGKLYLGTNNRFALTIDNSQDVGIGTTNPQGKLDVNGSIYQRGAQLHADYVFEPGYELESIDQHSEFMWQHKHLQAIPEAKVDEKGKEIIEVGAHRKGIVEELEKAHIYIEQLHERIKALEEKLVKLESGLNAEQ